MLVMIEIENVARELVMIAIDPWKVERIGPSIGEEKTWCYLTLASSSHSWRVKSSLGDLVNKINNARMGGKQ